MQGKQIKDTPVNVPSIPIEERLQILANLIVDRLLEEQKMEGK